MQDYLFLLHVCNEPTTKSIGVVTFLAGDMYTIHKSIKNSIVYFQTAKISDQSTNQSNENQSQESPAIDESDANSTVGSTIEEAILIFIFFA